MVQHGDIDHTGITGVGGSVATDAIWDAKGDLAGGTGANTAQKLTVGANGLVLVAASGETTGLKWSYPPAVACHAVRTTTQTIGTGAWTAISYVAADKFDTHTMHDPGGANPERIVPPVTGYYQVNARAQFAAEATGDRYLTVYVAGAQYLSTIRVQANSTIGNVLFIAGVCFLTATTDYVEGRVFQDAGSNRTLSSGELSLALIGV
jgi:hypothetical protein